MSICQIIPNLWILYNESEDKGFAVARSRRQTDGRVDRRNKDTKNREQIGQKVDGRADRRSDIGWMESQREVNGTVDRGADMRRMPVAVGEAAVSLNGGTPSSACKLASRVRGKTD